MESGVDLLPPRGPKVPEVFKLDDGTVVQWRTGSRSGGETMEMFPPRARPQKVRIA